MSTGARWGSVDGVSAKSVDGVCRRVRGGRVSAGVRRGEAGVGGVSVDGCEVGECRRCRRRQHVSTMLVASTSKVK